MKPIDFQGIITLNQPLVEDLNLYLKGKESQLAVSILNAIHPLPRESLPPVLPFSSNDEVYLKEAVEVFSKNVASVASSEKALVSSNDWELAVRQVNTSMWEYVEVLEGCVTELFLQLSQVGFEQWRPELLEVVESVKNILLNSMNECETTIKQMEANLWDYRSACESRSGQISWLKKMSLYWTSLLDRSLRSYLDKSRRLLTTRSKWFSKKYSDYLKLKHKIDRSLRKFKGYHVFGTLEDDVQTHFKRMYELLKLWRLNTKTNSLPSREPVRALRSAYSMDKAAQVFSEYYRELKETLFGRSRKFKSDPNDLYLDVSSRHLVEEVLKGYQAEVHALGATIENFREFYLRTHPNPYVRTRWGFSEWVVGPEPKQARELLDLVYKVELLDKLFEKLSHSLQKGPSGYDSTHLSKQYREVESILHEMGQPLTSRGVMRARAEDVLEKIEEIDELASFNPSAVDYVGKIFSKALRADWQFHVLFEIPLFHQLYAIHQGILGPDQDRQHLNRLNKFNQILDQLKGWVKNRDTHRHVHEIETDMNDMRGYLQDFLGSVQRLRAEGSLEAGEARRQRGKIAQQLLEYRYTFGNFFHLLHQNEPEGKLIRNQFLFVDQYFEAVESQLHEMRNHTINTQ